MTGGRCRLAQLNQAADNVLKTRRTNHHDELLRCCDHECRLTEMPPAATA